MPEPGFADLIRTRREAVRVSQAMLAWIARVSRNTVSNIERDEVKDPDERVIENLTAALGTDAWPTIKAALKENRRLVFVDSAIVGRMIEIIEEVRSQNGEYGRLLADGYVAFMDNLRQAKADTRPSVQQALSEAIGDLAEDIVPRLDMSNPVDVKVSDFFEDLGWSPEDSGEEVLAVPAPEQVPSEDSGEPELEYPMGEVLRQIDQKLSMLIAGVEEERQIAADTAMASHAFLRLPLRVQSVIENGDVIDSEVLTNVTPSGKHISFVAFLVRELDDDGLPSVTGLLDRDAYMDIVHAFQRSMQDAYFNFESHRPRRRGHAHRQSDRLPLFEATQGSLFPEQQENPEGDQPPSPS